jgi:hypothetical protein
MGKQEMTNSLHHSLANLFIACRDYYLTNSDRTRTTRGQMYRQLKKALTATLKAMASLHECNYPGYVADKDHVGYLIKYEPPLLFRIPYHVLPSFPTGKELVSLWQLSRQLRSGKRSVIAISGSNVLRKIFEVVGDIDFCEYLSIKDEAGYSKVIANTDGSKKIACAKLAFGGTKWEYPWGDNKPTEDFFKQEVDVSDANKCTMKADYIGDVDCFGVTEISNLIIVVDENGRSAGLNRTFAAQEAPLVPIDWLPNQMNDPIEMGRYVAWLTDAIVTLSRQGDMRKCLKRCASLSRVIFAANITDKIANLGNGSPILLEHKRNELRALAAALNARGDARSHQLGSRLESELNRLADPGLIDESIRQHFNDEVRNIGKLLLGCLHVNDGLDLSRAA